MEVAENPLPGAFRLTLKRMGDARGSFIKTLARSVYDKAGINFDFAEEYYSISRKDVIRGMHFQKPPQDHDKIVYCIKGAVDDVMLDLRPGESYGRTYRCTLDPETPSLVFIPKGVAHGFRALVDGSVVVCKTSTEYSPQDDMSIRWDSFGLDWNNPAPIVSDKDRNALVFGDFESPF